MEWRGCARAESLRYCSCCMKKAPRVLILDGSVEDAAMMAEALRAREIQVEVLHDGQQGLERALGQEFDAVITEYRLSGAGGLQVISTLHTKKPRMPVLLVTGARDGDVAIRA